MENSSCEIQGKVARGRHRGQGRFRRVEIRRPEAWSRYAVEEAHRLPEDWRLPIDDRTKKQAPSFMSLLKPPPSPVKIAANQQAGSGVGVRGSRGVTVNLRGQSVDSTMVVSEVAQPEKPLRPELKGLIKLTGHVFSERWTTFSGFAGPPKRGDADLLIQKGLLVRWRRTGGEPLLNLKDLLAVLPPSLKRVFETGPI